MIDYDSFSRCHLTDIFFAFHADGKELSRTPGSVGFSCELMVLMEFITYMSSSSFSSWSKWVSEPEGNRLCTFAFPWAEVFLYSME